MQDPTNPIQTMNDQESSNTEFKEYRINNCIFFRVHSRYQITKPVGAGAFGVVWYV